MSHLHCAMAPIRNPGSRHHGRKLAAFLIALCLLAGCTRLDPSRGDGAAAAEPSLAAPESGIPAGAQEVEVVRVVDGDTIVISQDGSEHKVRYILIDTPEQGEPLYNEATKLNQLLIGGQTVHLIKDMSETDRYGRLLRYVYTQDGVLVNAEIVRQGLARVAVFPPDTKLEQEIRVAETEARERKIGIWN